MYRRPTVHSDNVAIEDKIGSSYEDVKIVADNIDAVISVSEGLEVSLKYLGAHIEPPTERLNGDPLEDGDYYFDTTDGAESLVYYDLLSTSWFVVDPQAVLDAADAAEVSKVAAELAATTATTKAGEASTSATAAATSATQAEQSHQDAIAVIASLSNVDNTSDLDKPVSTAQQAALDLKVDTSRTVNGKPLTSDIALIADDINDSGSVNKWSTAAEKTKLGNISVTQSVDLDTLESDVSANNAKVSNVTTDLGYTSTATTGTVTSSDGTDATIPAATNSIAGLQTSTDKAKLDGIEAGATADQSAVEIKTAYESNSDTNVFTDAEKSKLAEVNLAESLAIVRDSKTTSGDDVSELAPFITPATVANQFSIPATVKYIDGLRVDIPETLITLPAAPDGLDKLDGTGRYVDLAAAIVAGGNDLTQSVITRQDVVVYDVTNTQYVVHQGLREYSGMVDAMVAFNYTQDAKDKNLWRDVGGDLFVMICHPQLLNQGAYHPEYNSNGTSCWIAASASDVYWYKTYGKAVTSLSDCFNFGTQQIGEVSTSGGNIGATFYGRPSNWNVRFHDAVTVSQIHDVRAICNHKSKEDILVEFARKGIADVMAGSEAVPFTKVLNHLQPASITYTGCYVSDNSEFVAGDVVTVFNDVTNLTIISHATITGVGNDATGDFITWANDPAVSLTSGQTLYIMRERDASAEFSSLPYQFLIAHPDRLAATFPDGVHGQWLGLTAQSVYPFTRKLEGDGTHTRVFTVDDGVNWTAGSTSPANFNTIKNELDLTGSDYSANHVAIHQFNADANPYELANNTILESDIGDAFASQFSEPRLGGALIANLIGKVPIGSRLEDGMKLQGYALSAVGSKLLTNGHATPRHDVFQSLVTGSPTAKTFPYITSENGQYFLQWVYKEMIFDVDWGDNNKFTIINGESTEPDENGNTVIVGQKRTPLPYFTGE